jgi:hypothetical protein
LSTKMLTPCWMQISGADIKGTSVLGASFTSDAVEIQWVDNVAIQLKWAGDPTGTFTVQTSLDPTLLGWVDETFTSPTQPAGSASGYTYRGGVLNQTAMGYVRISYTRASGSGTLFAKIAAKSI